MSDRIFIDRYSPVWNDIHGVKLFDGIPTAGELESVLSGWLSEHSYNAVRWTHMHKNNALCPVCNYRLTGRTNRDMDFHQLEIRTTPDDGGIGHLITYKLTNFQEHGMDIDGMFWNWCKERVKKSMTKRIFG